MTCTFSYPSNCSTFKKYIQSGQGGQFYHGEICIGCRWWTDTAEDKAFWRALKDIGMNRDPIARKGAKV